MYHPAAALRSPGVERESFEDMARVPDVLVRAREARRAGPNRRAHRPLQQSPAAVAGLAPTRRLRTASSTAADPAADDASQLTLF